jgi:hypothetical protein
MGAKRRLAKLRDARCALRSAPLTELIPVQDDFGGLRSIRDRSGGIGGWLIALDGWLLLFSYRTFTNLFLDSVKANPNGGRVVNATWKRSSWAVGGVSLFVGALVLLNRAPAPAVRAAADDKPVAVGPRYTVLETDGSNLLVTDNETNTFYFYTIDKDKEIGSELKLRGTIDLKKVGQPVIKPMQVK